MKLPLELSPFVLSLQDSIQYCARWLLLLYSDRFWTRNPCFLRKEAYMPSAEWNNTIANCDAMFAVWLSNFAYTSIMLTDQSAVWCTVVYCVHTVIVILSCERDGDQLCLLPTAYWERHWRLVLQPFLPSLGKTQQDSAWRAVVLTTTIPIARHACLLYSNNALKAKR